MEKKDFLAIIGDDENAIRFANYCLRTKNAVNRKTGKQQNPWINSKTVENLCEIYQRTVKDGMPIDGEHITIQSTGISYDYIALKNKMYLIYPESLVDVQVVYEGDTFSFEKEDGKVLYKHDIASPFTNTDDKIIGVYCVIKNKRGEFLTTLTKAEIEKHRKVAKQDYIWSKWFKEMSLKTVIKKACKLHFSDYFSIVEELDNENYDLENPVELDLKYKQEIEAITDIEKLKEYYNENKGIGADFDKAIMKRKEVLNENL